MTAKLKRIAGRVPMLLVMGIFLVVGMIITTALTGPARLRRG